MSKYNARTVTYSSDEYYLKTDGYDLNSITYRTDGQPFRMLYVGVAGDVVLTKLDETDITIPVKAGVVLPIQYIAIKDSGTDADEILACF